MSHADSPRKTGAAAPRLVAYEPGAKPAGSPVRWYRKYKGGVRRGDVFVPCDGCTACCRCYDVPVAPGEAAGLDTVERGGELFLRRQPDGSCVHLGDGGCSVYGRRPLICRIFDCRVLLYGGVLPAGDGPLSRAVRRWRPSVESVADVDMLTALRLAVAALQAEGLTEAESLAGGALVIHEAFLPAARELRRRFRALPNAEKERLSQYLLSAAEAKPEFEETTET
jgi:Putative zinc- or iron-chelating domain